MVSLRVCIDVDDLDRGIAFYAGALGLAVGRRFGSDWVELLGAGSPVDLLAKASGTRPSPNAPGLRDYGRHWTPVHLDFVVTDLDVALARCIGAGAVVEQAPQTRKWGRIAILADPFGHGLCLLEFRGRGYDEVLAPG